MLPPFKARIRSKDNPSNDVLLYVNFSLRLLIRFVAVTHSLIKKTTINEYFQRLARMRNPSTNPRLSSAQTGRKLAIILLAVLIVSVMITWLGFLGWGVIAILQWMLYCVKNLWT